MTEVQRSPIANFGGNVTFTPGVREAPRTEEELLDAMRRHRGRRIRAIGRLHSWSDAAVTPDVLIDLRHLDSVTIHEGDDPTAEVGAGCQIKRLLEELLRRGFTTPTLGLITEQTIAGAAATGTHGSGRSSISHFIRSVRIACFDPTTGEPILRTLDEGDELRAARCGLGALGIVVSVQMPIRRQYLVEEHFRRHDDLDSVLAAEAEFPLQQFFLVPWRWDFYAQHRRETDRPRSRLAPLYRAYWSLGMDRAFHLAVISMARWLPAFCTTLFFRRLLPLLVPQGWKVVDRSDRQLTMEHQLFRHIEIEVFVKASRLKEAVPFVVWLLRHARGEPVECDPELRKRLKAAKVWDAVNRVHGQYLHHYPICIRKVLPDDTLISMASGDEPWYAISFISYARPERRAGFFEFSRVLASAAALLVEGRPHWGKLSALDPRTVQDLYPKMETFAAIRRMFDPGSVFGNAWLDAIHATSHSGERLEPHQPHETGGGDTANP